MRLSVFKLYIICAFILSTSACSKSVNLPENEPPAQQFISGHTIPAEFSDGYIMWDPGYADMPYLTKLNDGTLLATLTISDGEEGFDDQHVILLESEDRGENWRIRSVIEPPEGPEASWAMPFHHQGSLGVVYTYNTQDLRRWPMTNGEWRSRTDMLGDLAVRHSFDDGRSWSERVVTDIPETDIDRQNGFAGKETVFWMSGAPINKADSILIGLSKGGETRPGDILPVTEAFLARSSAPFEKNSWQLLPSGSKGFQAPDGSSVAEEPSVTTLGDDGLYVVFRTATGMLGQAVSEDDGKSWRIEWARHVNGAIVANPRAKPVVKNLGDNRYLLWFHDNSSVGFDNRNPAVVSCGIGSEQTIKWEEPLPVIRDPNPTVRISYPSFLIDDETVFISATNKEEARLFRFHIDSLCSNSR